MTPKQMATHVLEELTRHYKDPGAFLHFSTPWQCLVATALSAQCTDERVNMVTPALFKRWPGPQEMAQASQQDVEDAVRSTGFFRNKAKNLIAAGKMVMTEFEGQVPRDMKSLVRIPGVARKTANIVLTQGYGIVEGIAVDTHVKRLAFRMGLTEETNPDKVEKALCSLFPQQHWGKMNHLLILHGRLICTARKPNCPDCFLAEKCPKKGVNIG